jgi:hypothetical protein
VVQVVFDLVEAMLVIGHETTVARKRTTRRELRRVYAGACVGVNQPEAKKRNA